MRKIPILTLFATLAACATPYTNRSQPGYACGLSDAFGGGTFRSEATVPDYARPTGTVTWQRDYSWAERATVPQIQVSWSVRADGNLYLEDGRVSISLSVPQSVSGNARYERFGLEVRTTLSAESFIYRQFPRQEAGTSLGYYIGWSELIALARGAPKLYVIVRDQSGRMIHHRSLDHAYLESLHAEFERSLREVNAALADPRKHCEHEEDLNEEHVVLT